MTTHEQICLHISEDVRRILEERRIQKEDVQKAIHKAETSGAKFINLSVNRTLAFYRPKTVTYWVEYSRTGEGYQIHSAYSHRMGMKTGGGLSDTGKSASDDGWSCNLCAVPLEVQTVRLQYMQCIFPHNLPVCPSCNAILILEELATGKIAAAEQVLEDK